MKRLRAQIQSAHVNRPRGLVYLVVHVTDKDHVLVDESCHTRPWNDQDFTYVGPSSPAVDVLHGAKTAYLDDNPSRFLTPMKQGGIATADQEIPVTTESIHFDAPEE